MSHPGALTPSYDPDGDTPMLDNIAAIDLDPNAATKPATPTAPAINPSPQTAPYSESFENELMSAILYPGTNSPAPATALAINTSLNKSSRGKGREDSLRGESSRQDTVEDARENETAPIIPPTILPLPLSSPLRTYPSPIPGVLLTHAHGYHTGGPGPSAHTLSQFASNFLNEHDIQDSAQLRIAVEARIGELMEEVKERMRDREEAVRRNEEVRSELEDLEERRNTEVRVLEKTIREKRERREARRGVGTG